MENAVLHFFSDLAHMISPPLVGDLTKIAFYSNQVGKMRKMEMYNDIQILAGLLSEKFRV
jgi:hypothetical protein